MANVRILSDFRVYACSRNPIAVWAVKDVLRASASHWCVDVLRPRQLFVVPQGVHILLIDVSSMSEWPDTVSRWTCAGHRAVLLVPESWGCGGAESRALHLGVRGIVEISQNFARQLPEAINLVANGQLFATGEALRGVGLGPRSSQKSVAEQCLSFREEQVMDLLVAGFSNRKIGTVLGISERTAKFHVCNILRKLQVARRKDLFDGASISHLAISDKHGT